MVQLIQALTRVAVPRGLIWQRFLTTEAVKSPQKASATPAPKSKALKAKKVAAPSVPKPKALKSPVRRAYVNAYIVFIQQFAAERKKAGERFSMTDAANAYNHLSESEKSQLMEQVPAIIAQRKSSYDEFVKNLSPSEIVAENRVRAALRKARIAAGKSVAKLAPILDENAPKKPQSAYLLWFQDARQAIEYQGMSMTEQGKALGEQWRSMAEEEKAKWYNTAAELRKAWEKKKAEYYGS